MSALCQLRVNQLSITNKCSPLAQGPGDPPTLLCHQNLLGPTRGPTTELTKLPWQARAMGANSSKGPWWPPTTRGPGALLQRLHRDSQEAAVNQAPGGPLQAFLIRLSSGQPEQTSIF